MRKENHKTCKGTKNPQIVKKKKKQSIETIPDGGTAVDNDSKSANIRMFKRINEIIQGSKV